MQLQKTILKILLWSLGIGAAVGVIAVLTGGGDVVARVVCTAFVTSGAAAVMLPLSRMIDKPESRPAGLFGLSWAVLVFFLFIILTWWFEGLFNTSGWDELFGSAWTIFILGLFAIAYMRFITRDTTILMSYVGLAVCATATLTFLIGIWSNNYRVNDEIFGTAFVIATYGGLASLCLVAMGSPDRRWWRWLGVATAVFATGGWIVHIWKNTDGNPFPLTFLTCATFMTAYSVIVLLVPLKPNQQWLRIGTMSAVALTLIMISALAGIAGDLDIGDTMLVRFIGAGSIVSAFGTIALAVFARINRRIEQVIEDKSLTDILLYCPRCEKKQKLPLGKSQCIQCKTILEIKVSEPICDACGYNLTMTQGDSCPECGKAIESAMRGVEEEKNLTTEDTENTELKTEGREER